MNYSPVKIRARVSSLLLSDCNYFDINPGKIFKWKKTKEEVDTTFQIQIDTNSKEENETIYLVKPGYLYEFNELYFLTYLENICVPISKDDFGHTLSENLVESKTEFEETLYGKLPLLTPKRIYLPSLVRKYAELQEEDIIIHNQSTNNFIEVRIRVRTLGSDDFFPVESNKNRLWRRTKGKYLVEILNSLHQSSRYYVETGNDYIFNDENKLYNKTLETPAEQIFELFSHITYITKFNKKIGGFEHIDIIYEDNHIYDLKNKDYVIPYFNNIAPNYIIGKKFIDAEFPPNSFSLLAKNKDTGDLVRPHFRHLPPENFSDPNPEFKTTREIFKNKPYYLFKDTIDCNDVRQGQLGNCYLISIIAALSERHDLISKIFKTQTLNPDGFYEIYFYETDGTKHIMFLDDYFPFLNLSGSSTDEKNSLCAISNGEEIWVMLLEKAYAKYEGGWANIQGGLINPELKFFTGYNCKDLNLAAESAWKEILDACKRDNIVCCRSVSGSGSHSNKSEKNIANSHAYSILEADEYKGVRLLKIRNPWGDTEWTGDYSDNSTLWTEELKEYFKVSRVAKDDGIFFMSFEDFTKEFNNVVICYC